MKSRFLIIISFFLLLVHYSCNKHDIFLPETESDTSFVLSTQSTKVPSTITKAIHTSPETEIVEVYALVFNRATGLLIEMKKGYSLSYNASEAKTTFKASLSETTYPVTVMVIANVDSAVETANLNIGVSDSTSVTTAITIANTTSGIETPLPMVGKVFLNSISASGSQSATVQMLRSIARADIVVDASVTNFVLESAVVHRGNSKIQVIPNDPNEDINWSIPVVSSASVPATSTLNINITDTIKVNDLGSIVSRLYVPEAEEVDAGGNGTSVIIAGYYNGSNVLSYYRLDFSGVKATGHNHGQILRNHRYIFNIIGVHDEGTSSVAAASASTAMNVVAEIVEWNIETEYMISNGKDYIGLSDKVVTMHANIGCKQYIDFQTNFFFPELMIQLCDINGTLSGTAINGLSNGTLTVKDENGVDRFEIGLEEDSYGIYITVKTLSLGHNTESRTGYFAILTTREHFKIQVTIEQQSVTYDEGKVTIWGRGSIGNVCDRGNTTGFASILANSAYFGPNGTVEVVKLDRINAGTNHDSPAYSFKREADIVDLAYYSNLTDGNRRSLTAVQKASQIIDWFKETNYHRFLRISPEAWSSTGNSYSYDISKNFLPMFLDATVTNWSLSPNANNGTQWVANYLQCYPNNSSGTWVLEFVDPAATNNQTEAEKIMGASAPFGEVNIANGGNTRGYGLANNVFGVMKQNSNGTYGPPGYDFIPLVLAHNNLTGPTRTETHMLIGIDFSKRVVFIGDGGSMQRKSSHTTAVFRVVDTSIDPNTTGYEANRLYANLYAYMINYVLANRIEDRCIYEEARPRQ